MRKNQQGASYIAILFAIMGFAFMAKVAIAVWAPYFDDRMINSQIEEVFLSPLPIYKFFLMKNWQK
jgi:hypothetical protein